MIKQLLKYKSTIAILFLLAFIIAFAIYTNMQYKTDTFINNKTKSAEIEYKAIYTKIKEQSEMVFQESINIPTVINSFKNAYSASEKDQNIIRKKLYNDLLIAYQRLNKLIHLRQVHFHFPDNRSFLRMHKPDKFGDDLTAFRATVDYVNKTKKPVDGFEEGRVYNGFRFVYPLFDGDRYIGSVEVSFSIESFNNVLDNEIHSSKFIILKSIIDEKVWKEDAIVHYEETVISPLFLIDQKQLHDESLSKTEEFRKKITFRLKLDFSKNIIHEQAFSLAVPSKDITYLLTFLPIKNPISGKVVSYIVLTSQSSVLNDIQTEQWVLQSLSVILILIIFIFLYRSQENHDLMLKSESKYTNIIENIKEHYFFYSHDIDGVFIHLSDSISNILGYTKEEFMEHYSTYLTKDPINNLVEEMTNKTMEGEFQEPYIISIYHKDGSKKYLEVSETRVNDSNGNFISLDGVARDVTQNYLVSQELKEKNSELIKRTKKLDEVFEASGEGIWDWNVKTNHVEHNNKWYEILGLENDKDLIEEFTTLIHPEDKESVLKKIDATLSGDSNSYHSEHRLFKKNGEVVWVSDKGHIVEYDDMENPLRMAGSFSVITNRKKAEKELKEQHKYLQSIIDGVNDPIMVIKEDYTIELMNETLKQDSHHITVADQKHPKCYEISHHRSTPCDGFEHPCPLRDVLESKEHTTVIHNHNTRDGEKRYIELSASPLFDKEENCIGIIESARDITEHLIVQDELRTQKNILNYQAHHDALTGLPNRVLFNDRLEQAIEKAKRNHSRFALLFLDLDHFKEINDSLGHAVGDEVLKIVTSKLKNTVRNEDTVARLGGDEFTVILEDLNQIQDASFITKKILKTLSHAMNVQSNVLYVSSSIGISIYPDDGQSTQDLLKFADSAMYKAKDEGRNNYQYYNPIMTELAFQRVVMETNLRDAIKNEEFVVCYQPQVNASTNKLIGMEALVRWKHPTMGLVLPSKFIPLA